MQMEDVDLALALEKNCRASASLAATSKWQSERLPYK